MFLLRIVDNKWMDHIDMMDQLKEGIRLRAYGQRDPIIEFRREGFDMFEEMIANIQSDTLKLLYFGQFKVQPQRHRTSGSHKMTAGQKHRHPPVTRWGATLPARAAAEKKYKNCCGKDA